MALFFLTRHLGETAKRGGRGGRRAGGRALWRARRPATYVCVRVHMHVKGREVVSAGCQRGERDEEEEEEG